MLPKVLQVIKDWVDGWPDQGPVTVKPSSAITDTKMGGPYSKVPSKWAGVLTINGLPNFIKEALKEYGVVEGASTANNARIVNWADEINNFKNTTYNDWAADWYNADSVPWCGLFVALICARTGRAPINKYLSSLAWAGWGNSVNWKTSLNNIWTGDIAVFTRSGGGHVAFIIGVSKDGKYLICIGGNQDNAVNIKAFPISRLYSVRRPTYTVKPVGAKHLRIATTGVPVSTNEA